MVLCQETSSAEIEREAGKSQSGLSTEYNLQQGEFAEPSDELTMPYNHTVRGVQHSFADLRTLLAKASPLRSGDELAGVAASGAEERAIAQMTLAELPLNVFQSEAVVP